MATKQIDRLLFIQGNNCFFCKRTISKNERSVEHLVASSLGGKSTLNNCVVCCKSLNSLFGNISLKEKIEIILRQNGRFKCPNKKS